MAPRQEAKELLFLVACSASHQEIVHVDDAERDEAFVLPLVEHHLVKVVLSVAH